MPYLFHVSAQSVSQLSGRSGCSGRVSTFGSYLKSCLDSSHVSQSVVRNKDWDRRQLEEQDVYGEGRHPVFCWVIKSVNYEISYIQPIHWWDFRFTFWQGIELERRLLAHELCLQILLSLNSTFDLQSPTFDKWPTAASTFNLWLDLWPNFSFLISDFWPLTYGRADLQPLTRLLTWLLTFDRWPTAVPTWLDLWLDFLPLTTDLRLPTCDFLPDLWPDLWPNLQPLTFDLQSLTNVHVDLQPFTQLLIRDLWSPAFNQPFFSDNSLFHPVFIISGTGNVSRDESTFKKLQGPHNYNQWTRDMSFRLEKARLWRHVEETAVSPPLLKTKEDDS